MPQSILRLALLVAALFYAEGADAQAPTPIDSKALVQKIQAELSGASQIDDRKPDPSVPHGEFVSGAITDSKIYPGTENGFSVYVPAQYDPAKPACLLVKLDGLGAGEAAVLDGLIAKKVIPVVIGVGITPGTVWSDRPGTPKRHPVRYDRCYEFDSTNDHFPDYVLNELLPAVQKLKTQNGRQIHLSPDGNDRAAMGFSSGGIGSFTLAWRRPDQFSRVYDAIGTFVSMRGGHEYPALIRKTEPKAIRIFLEDGSTDAWNLLFGSWYDANLNMESALSFAGYDVAHAWGTHGHNGSPGMAIFPDVMRWLWRDYPARVEAGISQNSTLKETTVPGQGWQIIPQTFRSAAGLAANSAGDVYVSDAPAAAIYRLGADGRPAPFIQHGPAVTGQAFGPDGVLYGVLPAEKKIVAFDSHGVSRTVADGIAGHGILVAHDGSIYVTEPGEHSDMPSRIWRVKPGGEKTSMDDGLLTASGLAFSPDGSLFFAAENSTKWVYSYVVQPDGTFADKQPFDWLHMTDIPNNSGAEDMATDIHGNLYVATRMGVQICDQNGRVRAILPLPSPAGAVRGICFGGPHFDILYVTDGVHVFKRPIKLPGFAPWASPIVVPGQGMG
jgi:sugar lactone lactonase YvrE/enterochelin esterase-like enzyme